MLSNLQDHMNQKEKKKKKIRSLKHHVIMKSNKLRFEQTIYKSLPPNRDS
ncbi:hypothetical protein Hanom_Chr11g00969621 [Helianthus anomalus]